MSAKYESQTILYETAATRIELVRHRKLGELRICKAIAKQSGFSSDHFHEAKLLSQLRHPGIPILYDLEEDASTVYLVEEYIQGQSLKELTLYQESFSPGTVLQYAIQLCEIIEFLHHREPYPILYQDMKPDHIIVCGNQIKLIDYGIANFLTNQGNHFQKYGTIGYAAPEQMTAQAPDERSDVYGVGRILQYLADHSGTKFDPRIRLAAARATAKDLHCRTESISVLKKELEKISATFNKNQQQKQHLLNIAVVGSERGVGCTHFAMALTTYLNACGQKAYYRDMLGTATLPRLMRQMSVFSEKDGVIYHDNFYAVANYGPCIEAKKPPKGTQIQDCGTEAEMASQADGIIYVCSGTPWKTAERLPAWTEDDRCILVCSHCSIPVGRRLAQKSGKKVYGYAGGSGPFCLTGGRKRMLRALVREGKERWM